MSHSWFHVDAVPEAGALVGLDRREARHALGARRLGTGERVVVFDGEGVYAEGELSLEASRDGVEVRILRRSVEPEMMPALHVAAALPKGDRQAVMLSMLTQLGVSTFTPLSCARSVAKWSAGAADRAARIVLEACKQCHRARRLRLAEPAKPAAAAGAFSAGGRLVLIAHPMGRPLHEHVRGPLPDSGVAVLIGPEGGFTDREIEDARGAGAALVSLGSRILRTETAAVAAGAVLGLGVR